MEHIGCFGKRSWSHSQRSHRCLGSLRDIGGLQDQARAVLQGQARDPLRDRMVRDQVQVLARDPLQGLMARDPALLMLWCLESLTAHWRRLRRSLDFVLWSCSVCTCQFHNANRADSQNRTDKELRHWLRCCIAPTTQPQPTSPEREQSSNVLQTSTSTF